MKSQHWLFGLLGGISLGSVLYTAFVGDIGIDPTPDRKVESQHSIDTLTTDMQRLMKSISNWQAFCEEPYAYLKSASTHGNFEISLIDQWTSEDFQNKSQITRDALGRCMKDKSLSHSGQFRICLSVKENALASGEKAVWFDNNHIFEVNVEFREGGAKLLGDCKSMSGKRVEMQSFFSAYTDRGRAKKAGRISGGVRLPLESASL